MKILLTVAYDGTNYAGWQRQLNGMTVQEKLEHALSALYGISIDVAGASRTDAGVHALGQRASFETPYNPFPMPKLPQIINAALPDDIVINHAQIVGDDFHVRYGAKVKTYCYRVHNSRFQNPMCRHTQWHVRTPLTVADMQEAAAHFIGTHDFSAFCASGGSAKTTVRTIYALSVNKDGETITITVCGNGFLYNMVRIMAGTLMYVGMGKIKPAEIAGIIAKGDRTLAGKTAPPHGLVLQEVKY